MFDILYPYMAHNEETRYIISFYTEISSIHLRGLQPAQRVELEDWLQNTYWMHKYKRNLSFKGR